MTLKNVIITSVLTTFVTNFLISFILGSWLFWFLAFIAGWLYLGYLGSIADREELNPFILFGPIYLAGAVFVPKTDCGFHCLWEHFTKRPFPSFSIQSPIKFNNEKTNEH